MSAATPRPLAASNGMVYSEVVKDGATIAHVREGSNARLIVRAVNHHEELVEALRRSARTIHAMSLTLRTKGYEGDSPILSLASRDEDAARALLARIEAEGGAK